MVLLKFSTLGWYLRVFFFWKFHLNGPDAYTRERLIENTTFACIKKENLSATQLRSFSRMTLCTTWLRPAPISQTDIFSKSAQICPIYQAFEKHLARHVFGADSLGLAAAPWPSSICAEPAPAARRAGGQEAARLPPTPAAPVPALCSCLPACCSCHRLPTRLLNTGRLNTAFSFSAHPSFCYIPHLSAHCCKSQLCLKRAVVSFKALPGCFDGTFSLPAATLGICRE